MNELMEDMGQCSQKISKTPTLLVFDLDYTLWPFWVDTHFTAPYWLDGRDRVVDSHGKVVKLFPQVQEILHKLHADGYILGVASRTSYVKEANQLLELFHLNQLFTYKEIYPRCKIAHFQRFHQKSGIPYKAMLFFDDEERNISDVESLGVSCVLAFEGINERLVDAGLKHFRNVHSKKKECIPLFD